MCLEVTSFKSTKSNKILTLAQIIDPFNADVNLKYERCNLNSYREKLKKVPQGRCDYVIPPLVQFLIESYFGWVL